MVQIYWSYKGLLKMSHLCRQSPPPVSHRAPPVWLQTSPPPGYHFNNHSRTAQCHFSLLLITDQAIITSRLSRFFPAPPCHRAPSSRKQETGVWTSTSLLLLKLVENFIAQALSLSQYLKSFRPDELWLWFSIWKFLDTQVSLAPNPVFPLSL